MSSKDSTLPRHLSCSVVDLHDRFTLLTVPRPHLGTSLGPHTPLTVDPQLMDNMSFDYHFLLPRVSGPVTNSVRPKRLLK